MLAPTLCVLAWGLLAGAASPQQPSQHSQHGPVRLAWKFKEKDRFLLESHVNQIGLRRSGVHVYKDVVTVQVLSSFTVHKVNSGEKTVVLDQKIEDARFSFDGTDRLSAALQADLFAKLAGATFRITLTEDGKVQKFEGYDALIRRLTEIVGPQDAERFRSMVSEESLKRATEEGFGCFPSGEVKHGETWTRPSFVPVPPAGVLKGDLTYTLRGVTKGKAKVTTKPEKHEFEANAGLAAGLKCEFALDARDGTLQFDIEKGRLVSAETVTRYKGRITGGASDSNVAATLLDVEMQQTVKITLRDRSRN